MMLHGHISYFGSLATPLFRFNLLTAVKGVGPWTTHMFMMFTLGRPDVLPTVDLGIRKGVMKVRSNSVKLCEVSMLTLNSDRLPTL